MLCVVYSILHVLYTIMRRAWISLYMICQPLSALSLLPQHTGTADLKARVYGYMELGCICQLGRHSQGLRYAAYSTRYRMRRTQPCIMPVLSLCV